jgi:hypothetical protein
LIGAGAIIERLAAEVDVSHEAPLLRDRAFVRAR